MTIVSAPKNVYIDGDDNKPKVTGSDLKDVSQQNTWDVILENLWK